MSDDTTPRLLDRVANEARKVTTRRQELFDRVARGIIAQGGPAWLNKCLYRTPEGRKCAFGHLIPDEKYDPSFETDGKTVIYFFTKTLLWRDLGFDFEDKDFLRELQMAHDDAAMSESRLPVKDEDFMPDWREKMQRVAHRWSLDPSAVAA